MGVFTALLTTAATAAPTAGDARNAAERAAFDKAKCVHQAMTRAADVFTPESLSNDGSPSEEMKALALKEIAAFEELSTKGVRECLTKQDVYDLGRYSYFEGMKAGHVRECGLQPAPALLFRRTPNNADGDMINGATRWLRITDTASIAAHPFFEGQSEAREEFRDRAEQICSAIQKEFGPRGSRMPGLVRR